LIYQIAADMPSAAFDGLPDAVQEGLTFFLEGLMSGFPVGISAHVLCEKIKAMFHVRNDCSSWERVSRPRCFQKLLNEGFDLSFQ